MKEILIFFIAQWYLSLLFQTFFHHRYSSHQQFTMSKTAEKFFFFFSWIFQGSNYLSPYGYGIMHRMHHAYADQPNDPHSPKYDRNLFAMMWKTKKIYTGIASKRTEVDARFTENVPEWNWFDRFARSWPSRIFWGLVYIAFYYHFATEWWMWLLLPVQMFLSPIHGAIINWFAHLYGYRNFEVGDTSKNFLPVDFLMLGESYHNNHHKHADSPNFGYRWHEIDPTYYFIKLMAALGVIKLKTGRVVKMDRVKDAA